MSDSPDQNDPFELSRFLLAQEGTYDLAIAEVTSGSKRNHWMWYIYPQLRELGRSPTSKRYGLSGIDEARAYLAHEILGERLIAACNAAISVEGRSATDIFGKPDDRKLLSCATLFTFASSAEPVFGLIIQKYFNGNSDRRTVELLGVL